MNNPDEIISYIVYKPTNQPDSKYIREYVIYKTVNGIKKNPGCILFKPKSLTSSNFYFVKAINEVIDIDENNKGICENEDLEFMLREYFRNEDLSEKARQILLD